MIYTLPCRIQYRVQSNLLFFNIDLFSIKIIIIENNNTNNTTNTINNNSNGIGDIKIINAHKTSEICIW